MSEQKPEHLTWFEPHGEFGHEVRCTCGWKKRHARAKVRDRAAAAHLADHPTTPAVPDAGDHPTQGDTDE